MFPRAIARAPCWVLLLATLVGGRAAPAMSADGVLRFPDDGNAQQAVCGAVIDAAHGFAYIGTDDAIVKLSLPTFARVGSIALDPTDAPVGVVAAVIDPAHGFAYFGTRGNGTVPAKLLKLDLPSFRIVGALVPTTAFPHSVACTAIDPTRQLAYVAVGTHVYQVNLATFQLTAAVATLGSSEQPVSAAADPAHGMLYIGAYNHTVIQFSAGGTGMTRVATVTLAAGEGTGQAMIDPTAGFAYFTGGGSIFTKKVAQVRLSPFGRVGGIDLSTSLMGYPQAGAYDATNHTIYLGTAGDSPSAQVVKVGVGASGMVDEGVLSSSLDAGGWVSAVVDPAAGHLYLVAVTDPVRVQRVDIGSSFAFSGRISCSIRVSGFQSELIDSAGGYAYFLTDVAHHPSTIAKVRMSDHTLAQELVLAPDDSASCWVIDPAAGFLYVGTAGSVTATSTTPSKILKIRLSDLTQVGSLVLPAGDVLVWKAGADLARHIAYFASTSSSHIIEISIDPADFSRIGSIPLSPGFIDALVVDPGHRLAYVHQGTSVSEVDLAGGRLNGRTAPLAQALVGSFFDAHGGSPHFIGTTSIYQLAEAGMSLRSVAAPSHETFTGGDADGTGMAYVGMHYWDLSTATAKGEAALLRLSDLALVDKLTLVSATSDTDDLVFHAFAVDPAHGKGLAGSDGDANGVVYGFTLDATAANRAPTISAGPTAAPDPVSAKTTALSVTAGDDGGETGLTYTWSSTGPAAVTFSANGTNAAKSATATFARAGSYVIVVTVSDAGGLTATGSATVTVTQTLTAIAVSPTGASVAIGGTQQFGAGAKDQFGAALAAPPAMTWSVTGGGTIDGGGLFSAGAASGGPFTVTATSGSVHGSAQVTVTAASASAGDATGTSADPAGGSAGSRASGSTCGLGGSFALLAMLALYAARGRRAR